MIPCVRCGKLELIERIDIGILYGEILFMANCINKSCSRDAGYWVVKSMNPERVSGCILIEDEW